MTVRYVGLASVMQVLDRVVVLPVKSLDGGVHFDGARILPSRASEHGRKFDIPDTYSFLQRVDVSVVPANKVQTGSIFPRRSEASPGIYSSFIPAYL